MFFLSIVNKNRLFLKSQYDLIHISTGELIRFNIKNKTEWTGFLDNTTNKAEKSVIPEKK